MITTADIRKLVAVLEGAEELPHFEKISFRVKKKIFATLDEKSNLLCVMLSPIDQSAFCAYDREVVFPVPNAWGKKGATYIDLKRVKKSVLKDAITTAYQCKAGSDENRSPARRDRI